MAVDFKLTITQQSTIGATKTALLTPTAINGINIYGISVNNKPLKYHLIFL
ncbi:hypothetical protein R50072_28140 [Simiduia litorea]